MKWESYSHPISDIRDWDNNNRLELKPDFQRNEVWSRAAQITLHITNKCRSLEPLVPYLESVSRTMLYPVSTLKSCDVSFEEQAHITL